MQRLTLPLELSSTWGELLHDLREGEGKALPVVIFAGYQWSMLCAIKSIMQLNLSAGVVKQRLEIPQARNDGLKRLPL
jgi:hypothetical protein